MKKTATNELATANELADNASSTVDIANSTETTTNSTESTETTANNTTITNACDIRYQNINYAINDKIILENVNFTVQKGHCCALVGHNGAGKTTLIKILLGVINQQQGLAQLCGIDMKTSSSKKARQFIGFVPEMVTFNHNLKAIDYLNYVAKLKSADLSEITEQAKSVEIYDALPRKIGEFSKGMRQRLALVQAMLGKPKVLILDEPTSGLDPESRLIFYNNLKNYAKKGNTVMFSSHALNDIEDYIDQFIILDRGKIVYQQLISDYQYTANFVCQIHFSLDKTNPDLLNKIKSQNPDKQLIENAALKYSIAINKAEKMLLLKQLITNDSVIDIKITEPNLEQIYKSILLNKTI